MQYKATADEAPRLHRVLGTRDLVLLNIAAIIGLRWLSTAAQIGPSSLGLWALGLVTFFLPLTLAVLELSSRIPGEGGLYLWTKAAFGDVHGFIAGWATWTSNVVFFPSLLLFVAGVFLYIGGDRWLTLENDAVYNAAFCLTILWFATLLNVLGLQRAKWLQNVGGIATWLAGALVLFGGALAWHQFGAATKIGPANIVPNLTSLAALGSFATIALAYDGMELGPIMGGEIKNPRRTIARAAYISGIVIAILYIAGTAALLVALPASQINAISGIPQALAAIGTRVHISSFGVVSAVLITVSQAGSVGAWITGTARLPFVFGLDRYLPRSFGLLHPRFGSPYVSLIAQGALTSVVLLAALSGSTVQEAFTVLTDMTVILAFVPLLYLFASLPILRHRAAGKHELVSMIPGGTIVCWLVAAFGFSVTLLAIVVSMVPTEANADRVLFACKVLGGSLTMICIGLLFYFRGSMNKGGPQPQI